jgi:hypothetical protein
MTHPTLSCSTPPLLNRLIELLSPLIRTEAERIALFTQAFTGKGEGLLRGIEYGGSVNVFAYPTLDWLADHRVEGEPALWLLMKTAREHVGLEQQGAD